MCTAIWTTDGRSCQDLVLILISRLTRGHHAFEGRAVLGGVKTRATLCLLRLHVRKSRHSECAIVLLSFYPATLAQRTERLP